MLGQKNGFQARRSPRKFRDNLGGNIQSQTLRQSLTSKQSFSASGRAPGRRWQGGPRAPPRIRNRRRAWRQRCTGRAGAGVSLRPSTCSQRHP
eukprot:2790492-Pleurochrysis_carterae.AAC.3